MPITFAITSCGRFDLLEKTIDSFMKYNTYHIERYVLVEDSVQFGILEKIKNKYPFFDVIFNDSKLEQTCSIDRMYATIDTDYIFHCEDDWEFVDYSFIEKSLDVLGDDKIIRVWIGGIQDGRTITGKYSGLPVFPEKKHVKTGNLDAEYYLTGVERGVWGGFGFSPGLRRLSDYKLIGSYSTIPVPDGFIQTVKKIENWAWCSDYFLKTDTRGAIREAMVSFRYNQLGYQGAVLPDVYIKHIGDDRNCGQFSTTKIFGKKMTKTICLSMIVKNESKVIERCLNSFKGIIDYWVICDTGSTDNTPELISKALEGIPGELHKKPWVNFAVNRNQSLEIALTKADYVMVLDADHILEVSNFDKNSLNADCYFTREHGRLDYDLKLLLNSKLNWRWEGVLHELPCSPQVKVAEKVVGIKQLDLGGGCRSSAVGNKFESDVVILKGEIQKNPLSSRNYFYLGQSYCGLNKWTEAIEAYQRCLAFSEWDEEQWYCHYKIGICKKCNGEDPITEFFTAFEMRPIRAEPFYELAEYFRTQNRFELGYLFGKIGLNIPLPENDRLFMDKSVYIWKLFDVVALCAYYTKRFKEAVEMGTKAEENLRAIDPRFRDSYNMKRVSANMEFYRKA